MAIRPATLHLSRTGLDSVVYGALVHMLGLRTADAIDFYVDTRLATDDPERYEQAILLLLGRHGGTLVMHGIRSELETSKGGERLTKESFGGQVRRFGPKPNQARQPGPGNGETMTLSVR